MWFVAEEIGARTQGFEATFMGNTMLDAGGLSGV